MFTECIEKAGIDHRLEPKHIVEFEVMFSSTTTINAATSDIRRTHYTPLGANPMTSIPTRD